MAMIEFDGFPSERETQTAGQFQIVQIKTIPDPDPYLIIFDIYLRLLDHPARKPFLDPGFQGSQFAPGIAARHHGYGGFCVAQQVGVPGDDGCIGMFPADGGVWKLEATRNVAGYFEKELKDLIESGQVVVIR